MAATIFSGDRAVDRFAGDTSIGGAGRLPPTRLSAVLGLRADAADERRASWEAVVQFYWKPVYKVIRIRWGKSNEDAKDLTQEFFVHALEKEFLQSYDPAKARFRTWLMLCLKGFLGKAHEAAGRLKRGGGAQPLSLDFASAEEEIGSQEPASPESLEDYFEREYVRDLFARALKELETECARADRAAWYELFVAYDVSPPPEGRPTYGELAGRFGLPETKVTNYLFQARRRFREIVLERLRRVTATDEEFREEARAVLGTEEP